MHAMLNEANGKTKANVREVFVYFISAAKERNPAAAMALIERLIR